MSQHQRALRVSPPSVDPKQLDHVIRTLARMYPRSSLPVVATEHFAKKHIIEVLASVNKTSSPGMPWGLLANSKGQLIEKNEKLLVDAVIARLRVLLETPLENLKAMTPAEKVRAFACDPMRVFVKKEMHPVRKKETKRWRLIMSCSIVDEVVDALLFESQSKLEYYLWDKIPSAPGMGLDTKEQIQKLLRPFEGILGDLVSSDVKGWDWSLRQWHFDAFRDMHLCLVKDVNERYRHLVEARLECIIDKVFVTSGGTMVTASYKGIMPSGVRITSSGNSKIRNIVAGLAAQSRNKSSGDDHFGLPEDYDTLIERYARLGHELTDVKRGDGIGVEFCSHYLTLDGRAIPLKPLKLLANALNKEWTDELQAALEYNLRDHPEKSRFLSVAAASGWGSNGKEAAGLPRKEEEGSSEEKVFETEKEDPRRHRA